MAGRPTEPQPSEHSRAAAGAGRREGEHAGPERSAGTERSVQEDERYGVLVIARHVKDDARGLILYTRGEGSQE